MADQNTPINGNYNSNSVSVSGLIDAINHLDATQAEVINALKSVANNKNIGVNSNDLKKAIKEAIKEGNKDTNSKSFKSYDYDTKKLDKYTLTYIKDMNKASDAFGNIKQTVNKLNRELDKQERSLGKVKFDSEFTEFRKHLTNLNNAIDASNKQSVKIDSEYRKKLADSVIKINSIRDSITKQNNYYERATSEEARKNILAKRAKLQQDLALAQEEHNLIKEEYDEKQNAIRRQAKLKNDELEELESLLSQRSRIEEKNNKLLSSSQSSFRDSLSKLKDTFRPRQSEEYLTQMAEADDDAKLIQSQIEQNEQETRDTEELIAKEDAAFTEFTKVVLKYEKLLEENKDTATEEQKDFWLKSKNDAMISRKKSAESRAELTEHKKSLNQQKKVLEGSKSANEKFKENLTKQTTIFAKLGDKLGSTISKLITDAVSRQTDLFVQAADKAFSSIEETQKNLGKTLKMSTGAYQEFVDMIQDAAKEAGMAIDQNQVLQLSASIAEMGIRDENLITTLAVEQAKMQEAGVGSIVQLNEETIRMYKNTYNDLLKSTGSPEKAMKALEEQMDKLIAIESTVADEFGNVDALANGGFAEVQNLTNQLVKAGKVDASQREEFEYQIARGMQTIAETGADPTLLLSDLQTFLTSTESNLSAELLSILAGNTDATLDQFSDATVEMINRYLEKNQAIYGNLNLTGAKYVAEAYGASGTVQDKIAMAKAEKLQGKKLEALETNTKKIQEDLKDGTYLTATEKMEKQQLEIMQDIAQKMQKIADGQWLMDQGLAIGKSWIDSLGGLLGSFLGSAMGSGLGNFGTNMSGSMSNTASTGGLGAFLTGNKATKAGVVGSEIAGAAGILYGEAILAKNAYEGYQEGGLKGGLVGLAEGTGDKEFARGMGMALGGALGGPVGAAIGGTLSAELVPKAQRSFEKLITSGIADPAADAYKEMKEAGDNLKESATQLSDSAQQQLKNLEQEKAQLEESSALEKKDWIKEHEEDFKSMGIDTKDLLSDLSSSDAINKAYSQLSEQYYKKAESDATQMLSAADLGSSIANVVGSRSTLKGAESEFLGYTEDRLNEALKSGEINEEQFNYNLQSIRERQGKTFLAGLSSEGATSSFVNYIESIAKDKKISLDEAVKEYGKTINADEDTINYMKAGLDTIYNRRDRYDKINTQFQKMYKEALEKANSDDPVAIEDAFEKLGTRSVKIEDSPFTSIDVSDLQQAIVDKDGTLWRDSPDKMPSLTTNNGTYAGYKIGLDYVPYDNYLALLHRGETVLNANEAQEYRTDNNINFDTITNTLVSQTDRIETILKQIYTAILTISRGSNRTTLNPNIVNMVSGIATL